MKQTMTTTTTIFAAIAMLTMSFASTFENIPLNTPTFSNDDPLGVGLMTNISNKVVEIESNMTTVGSMASNAQTTVMALETSLNTFKQTITNAVATTTNGTIVVGSMKGSPDDVGMISGANFMVFAVDRDSDELESANGQILMSADSIKFDTGLNSIYIGDKTLQSILSQSGQGEINVIESITTNGVALPINNRTVDIPLQDYVKLVDLQDGIIFDNMTVNNLTINGKQPSLEGHTHTVSEIDGLDSYKNPAISAAALIAIDGINNAQDIATIQSALTNFLHQFVIQAQ